MAAGPGRTTAPGVSLGAIAWTLLQGMDERIKILQFSHFQAICELLILENFNIHNRTTSNFRHGF
jgi:hypothetical protein